MDKYTVYPTGCSNAINFSNCCTIHSHKKSLLKLMIYCILFGGYQSLMMESILVWSIKCMYAQCNPSNIDTVGEITCVLYMEVCLFKKLCFNAQTKM